MAKTMVPPTYDQFSRPADPGLDFSGIPSMAKEEFAQEADLNFLMQRYTITGEVPKGITGRYEDFSEAPDFHAAQNILARAQEQFAAVPASIRARFENDVGQFLDFVHDPENLEELDRMGFLSEEASMRRKAAVGAAAVLPPVVAASAPAKPA